MSDRTRRAILERRRAFVAAALASLGTVSACEERPKVCLAAVSDESQPRPATSPSVVAPEDAGPPDVGPIPVACLSVAMPRDAGPGATPSVKPKATPCLSVLPE